MQYTENERFTEISNVVKRNLELSFEDFCSYDEVAEHIREFKSLPPDGRGDEERKIVKMLIAGKATGYAEKYGNAPLCADKTDEKSVNEAAEKYEMCARELPRAAELDKLFEERIFDIYKSCKSSADYMTRLVKRRIRILNPQLERECDTVRVLILKQFLRAAEFPKTTCMSRAMRDYVYETTGTARAGKKETINTIATVSDNIFDKLKEMPVEKEAKKVFREKWDPLIWANDIASGTFGEQQTTRDKLYIFAIVFEMTYYKVTNEESDDIQENLFYNYYEDNLLNSLAGGVEKEPTGHGINFKNFAEIIYLYYIHKEGMTAAEKLKAAKKMIARCKTENAALIDVQTDRHMEKNTFFYEPLARRAMNCTEEQLPEFICKNYICGQKGVNVIRVNSGNKTAAEVYKRLAGKLELAADEVFDRELITHEYIYAAAERKYYKVKCAACKEKDKGAGFKSCPLYKSKCINAYTNYRTQRTVADEALEIRKMKRQIVRNGIMRVLKTASDLFGGIEHKEFKNIAEKISKRFELVTKPSIEESITASFMPKTDVENYVTRTKMTALYYYIFILRCLCTEEVLDSFGDFCGEFCEGFEISIGNGMYHGINDILTVAGYQEINPKNIFDSAVVFMAFKKYKEIRYCNFEKEYMGDEDEY